MSRPDAPGKGVTPSSARSLYVVGEGAFGYKARVDAWETGLAHHARRRRLRGLPGPVNLTSPVTVANLAALIDWGGYGIVVLDTLARCMVGADENSCEGLRHRRRRARCG